MADTNNATVAFDASLALEQAGGNEALARELFGMLVNDLPNQRKLLAAAIQAHNPAAMWEHAHKLYGSTAYCGVPRLRTACKSLEIAIKAVDDAAITQTFAEVTLAIDELLQTAESWLQGNWQ